MRNKAWLVALLPLAAGSGLAEEPGAAERSSGVCEGQVEAPQQCQWIDGTVSISNGTPAVRIRQRGSQRVYAVGPSEQELMPADLRAKLTLDNAVDGRLRICPLKRHQPRGLRVVCIDEARLKTPGP
jgi:hypothetical protein